MQADFTINQRKNISESCINILNFTFYTSAFNLINLISNFTKILNLLYLNKKKKKKKKTRACFLQQLHNHYFFLADNNYFHNKESFIVNKIVWAELSIFYTSSIQN